MTAQVEESTYCDFTAQRSLLIEKLAIVSRAVKEGTTSLPILKNIALETTTAAESENTILRMTATNLDITIKVELPIAIPPDFSFFKTTVPAQLLISAVNDAASEEIEFKYLGVVGRLVVKHARGVNQLPCNAYEDFPQPTTKSEDLRNVALIDAHTFKNAIDGVAFAASTDVTRPVLTSVFLRFFNSENLGFMQAVGADSFRLAFKEVELLAPLADEVHKSGKVNKEINARSADEFAGYGVLVPRNSLLEFARCVKSGASHTVAIFVTKNKSQVIFEMNGFTFQSSLIEGNFPNYFLLLAQNAKSALKVTVETEEIVQANKQVSTFAVETNGITTVRFKFSTSELLITSGYSELGYSERTVSVLQGTAYEHDYTVDIAFNTTFVRDAFKAIEAKQCICSLLDKEKPMLIMPSDNDKHKIILMPIFLATR